MRAVARLAAAARASFAARTCAAAFASAAAAATAIARAITSRRRAVSGVTGFEAASACFVFVESARPEKPGCSPPASSSRTRLVGSVAGRRAASSSSDVHDEGPVDTSVRLFALPKRAAAGATGAGAAAISRSPRGAPAASPRDCGMYVELPPFQRVRSLRGGPTLEDAAGRARRSLALPGTPRAYAGPTRRMPARARSGDFSRLTVEAGRADRDARRETGIESLPR